MASTGRIVDVEKVPADTTFLFTVEDVATGEKREAVLVDGDGAISCWLNYCQHFTHVRVDEGSGAETRNGELVCTNHGAYFASDTGRCTHGPCRGAYLPGVDVTVEDGAVYLTDEAYDLVGTGGVERDELDRASKSNREF